MSDEEDGEDLPIPGEPEPAFFDAGDPAAVGKRRRNAKVKAHESDRFWAEVFASEVGRREMFALLRDAKAFEVRFACGPNGFPQPEATWFQAGESDWGRRMADTWMVRHPHEFILMLQENDPRFKKDSK